MERKLVSEEELLSILNKAIQNDVDCAGYSFFNLVKHGTETVDYNWDVTLNRNDTVTALGERKAYKIIDEARTKYNIK